MEGYTPPVTDGERVEDPAEFPGWNKDNKTPAPDKTQSKDSDLDHDKGKGNGSKIDGSGKKSKGLTSYINSLMNTKLASSDIRSMVSLLLAKKEESTSKSSDKGNSGSGNGNNPHNPGGDKLVNSEIFQVTNYINDLSAENEEVLMTSDVDGNCLPKHIMLTRWLYHMTQHLMLCHNLILSRD